VKRAFLWISAVAASLVALGVILQVYFIASWIFGAEDALDAHRGAGSIIWLLEIIVLVSGLVFYWGVWRSAAVSIALPVLGTIQVFFLGDIEDPSKNESGWLHGLHGGLAIFVFLLAAAIAYRDLKALGVHGRSAVAG